VAHPHLGAIYEIGDLADDTVEVIVTIPDMLPTTIKGFAIRALANKWIERHREVVALGRDPRKRLFLRNHGRTA